VTPSKHPAAQLPLRAVALLYGAAVRARNRYYNRPSAVHRAPVPVLSVGNLTVGGTGKTPLVAWLATRVADAGHTPAIVTRGYGGTVGRGPVVLSGGDGPALEPDACGDEPYLLASMLSRVPVVVGSDRLAGAAAAARLGSDVVILDDGFQHRRLARNLDIVLLDAGSPFGNGRLLPAGPLRELPSALGRADVVMITRSRRGEAGDDLEHLVRSHNADASILRAGHRRIGFFDAAGRPAVRPRRAVVFCGIGNPGNFRTDVAAEGVEIVAFEPRRDHHRYDESELRDLRARASSLNAVLVTTEKDRVRLPSGGEDGDGPLVLTLRIEAEPFDPDLLDDAVERAIAGGGRR
jgi:tetraacyldisaccharide 4'-kinase